LATDKKILSDFEKALSHNLAIDAAGQFGLSSTNNGQPETHARTLAQSLFHTTREHAVKL